MELRRDSICLFILLLGSLLSTTATAKTMVFGGITPGAQYIEKDKEAGPAVNLLKVLFAEADLDYQFEISNWAKTKKRFAETPKSLMFSVAKTPAREPHFIWLLDVGPLDVKIARSKTRPDLNPSTLAELKEHKVAVVRGDVTHHLLLQEGFVEGRDFGVVATANDIIKYMGAGLVEFVFYESTISPMMLQLYNYPADYLVPTDIKLPLDAHLWLTASLDFPQDSVDKIRQAHQKLLKDKHYQKLRKAVLPFSHGE